MGVIYLTRNHFITWTIDDGARKWKESRIDYVIKYTGKETVLHAASDERRIRSFIQNSLGLPLITLITKAFAA